MGGGQADIDARVRGAGFPEADGRRDRAKACRVHPEATRRARLPGPGADGRRGRAAHILPIRNRSRSARIRQYRDTFEREPRNRSVWQWDAFGHWLLADATVEVSAELRLLRDAFVREIEVVGEVHFTPQQVGAIVSHVGHFVRRAKWRGHPTDYKAARKRSGVKIKAQAEGVRDRLQKLGAALQSLPAPEEDPVSSDTLTSLQWLFDESLLGQAIQGLPLDHDDQPSEKLRVVVNDLDQLLQKWVPPRTPLWRSLLEPLLRVYETARGRPVEAASWYAGKPSGPFSCFLVMIYEALPMDARRFASASPEAFVKKASRLLSERRGGPVSDAQVDDSE
jgi:hypothetical protein